MKKSIIIILLFALLIHPSTEELPDSVKIVMVGDLVDSMELLFLTGKYEDVLTVASESAWPAIKDLNTLDNITRDKFLYYLIKAEIAIPLKKLEKQKPPDTETIKRHFKKEVEHFKENIMAPAFEKANTIVKKKIKNVKTRIDKLELETSYNRALQEFAAGEYLSSAAKLKILLSKAGKGLKSDILYYLGRAYAGMAEKLNEIDFAKSMEYYDCSLKFLHSSKHKEARNKYLEISKRRCITWDEYQHSF